MNLFDEISCVTRLGDHSINAQIGTWLGNPEVSGGVKNDGEVLRRGLLAQAMTQCNAVHPRHHVINDRKIGHPSLYATKRSCAVRRGFYLEPFVAEEPLKDVEVIRLIIYNKNERTRRAWTAWAVGCSGVAAATRQGRENVRNRRLHG
jgi:hypothetical protein